ncbi:hypothetical protein NIES2107_15850 [Nostoc carneum NIES-2107]|nr:hypothetical protein NIES2107_15850 [Nostoc carneum NIES-2107]
MSERIAIRCPDDIAAIIKQKVADTGQEKTAVIVDMLRASMPSLLVSEKGRLPNEPAIYFVWNDRRLLYIGKTASLCKRFMNHHRLANFVLAGENTRISWLLADAENLAAFECSLIEELEPELNKESQPKTQHIAIRCPDDLIDAIQKEIEVTGKDRTTVIVEAMRRGFSLPIDNETEQLKAELNGVKQRLNILEGKLIA